MTTQTANQMTTQANVQTRGKGAKISFTREGVDNFITLTFEGGAWEMTHIKQGNGEMTFGKSLPIKATTKHGAVSEVLNHLNLTWA